MNDLKHICIKIKITVKVPNIQQKSSHTYNYVHDVVYHPTTGKGKMYEGKWNHYKRRQHVLRMWNADHARLQAMLKAQENLKVITDARNLSAPEEHSHNESDDEPQLMGEAKAAMQDVQDMNDSSDDDITLDERVQMLNVDQKRIYEKVKMHLLHLLTHESEECSCDFKPLKMFVSDIGGTGKSFLIHALKSLIHLSCAIAAPTGLAAMSEE